MLKRAQFFSTPYHLSLKDNQMVINTKQSLICLNNWKIFSIFAQVRFKKIASNALRWRPNSHFVHRRIGVTSWNPLGKIPGVVV